MMLLVYINKCIFITKKCSYLSNLYKSCFYIYIQLGFDYKNIIGKTVVNDCSQVLIGPCEHYTDIVDMCEITWFKRY